MVVVLGVPNEVGKYEHRVSIVPEDIPKLKELGIDVLVESNAGKDAYFTDEQYKILGARIATARDSLFRHADIVTTVQRPSAEDALLMKPGSVAIGMMFQERYPETAEALKKSGAIGFALEKIPRITRAQSMDVLSSQSSVAGYRAALIAATNSPRLMPMLTTAAGTIKPSRVLVIGAGVAGLMAISTLRRLGASVTGYDVRRAAGEDVRSLGARFLEPKIDAVSGGGYARELTEVEKNMQKEMLESALVNSEAIISTASVPGRRAPLIIPKESVDKMSRGTIIVDLAADSGGNCELTKAGEVVEHDGVRIFGPLNLPAEVPVNASQMFSRNLLSFLKLLVVNGEITGSSEDEILSACLLRAGNPGSTGAKP